MPVFNKMVYNGTEYILGGGGNIGEPLNLTVTSAGLDATITWEDNEIGTIPPTTFQKSELVRKIGSAPTSPSDGDLVVTETVKDTYKASGYVDSGLTDGTTYYYRVFSYSDLGGISYCDAVSITASSSWQPGTNTIVYYPLDSTNTVNDLSGNNYNLTNNGNVTFGLVGGVDCATFGTSTPRGLVNTSASIISGQYTYLAWINMDLSSSYANGWARMFGGVDDWFVLCGDLTDIPSVSMGPQFPPTNGATLTSGWHLVCFVGDVSTGSFTSYLDGVYVDSGTGATGSRNGIVIGAKENNYYHSDDRFKGNMSAVIWENRQRTSQEISDYYDLTKGDYGIS